jgi:hypothetical protein
MGRRKTLGTSPDALTSMAVVVVLVVGLAGEELVVRRTRCRSQCAAPCSPPSGHARPASASWIRAKSPSTPSDCCAQQSSA